MKPTYSFQRIPASRIATFDVFSVGLSRHHVAVLLELDVSSGREKLKEVKKNGTRISFTAWIIKMISISLKQHPEVAAFLYNKKKLMIFDDINISILVEKKIGDKKVPMPVVIEKSQEKSIEVITREIEASKEQNLSEKDIVLNRSSKAYERIYYHLPGFIRRSFWRFMLRHPGFIYPAMGNVVVTSLGTIGRINGWFIHKSIHPVSFGIGSIIKKPLVVDDEVKIREVMNMTLLFDHDVIDGAPFGRFLKDLVNHIENGQGLDPDSR